MSDAIFSLVRGRRGHFLYESGYHGDVWFDLEMLCLRPKALRHYIAQLAAILSRYHPEVVCGPLVEGAFIGLLVAQELQCRFVYANRLPDSDNPNRLTTPALFPVRYRIPESLHGSVRNKRVAIVNDMISAGSAVRGAFLHLKELGADVPVVASLMLAGEGFRSFASEHNLKLETLAEFPSNLWTTNECPLCVNGEPLESLANA